jgi:hypothetical protein
MSGPLGRHPDELISASLTNDLTDDERAELDRHLAGCEPCRATLEAFSAERDLLGGLRPPAPPYDLHARVRAGIEGGGRVQPWWRSWPATVAASLLTVAAAVALVLVISRFPFGPVGQSGSPSPSASSPHSGEPSASVAPSGEPTPEPSAPGGVVLGPGQVGYLSLVGAPFEEQRLYFVNDATGASVEAEAPSGPVIGAALSPSGEWIAYITQKGETGANETWALRLADGTSVALGCSLAGPFSERLAWSADGVYLAYTLIAADLGPSSGCPANDGDPLTTDAWLFDTGSSEHYRLTGNGDAFAASFTRDEQPTLMVSHAATAPWTELLPLFADPASLPRIDDVFMPLFSPDGNRALFWRGTMAEQPESGAWSFASGGMPWVSGDFRSSGPASPWVSGEQLFADLVTPGGAAFASGSFGWGRDSDQLVFWAGAWNGLPEGGQGSYPNLASVYAGRISTGLLTVNSAVPLSLEDLAWIVDVRFTLDGDSLLVTVGLPSAGIGDPPSARLLRVPLDGSPAVELGGGGDPPPWNGPGVIGQ